MKKSLLPLSFILFMFASCGAPDEKLPSKNIYNEAIESIDDATTSEELVEISYALHLKLDSMAVADGVAPIDADAHERFEAALKQKEVEIYTNKRRK